MDQIYGNLTLIRGIPGSGKTTLAKRICGLDGAKHYEADMWMVDGDGNYCFDPAKLQHAHQICLQRTESMLSYGFDVVVSNTFIRYWEMENYKRLAYKTLTVIVANGNFQNIHGVPEDKVEQMRRRFEW